MAFWDLDKWMLIGEALILAGMIPIRARLEHIAGEERHAARDDVG